MVGDASECIVPDGEGLLCLDHMEKRLGRELVLADLKPLPDQDIEKLYRAIEVCREHRKADLEKIERRFAVKSRAGIATPLRLRLPRSPSTR